MAEILVPILLRLDHFRPHFRAVVAMEGVALDNCGGDTLAAEDLLEGCLHRGRSRARRTCDRDDRVFSRHGRTSNRFSGSGTESACGRAAFRKSGLLPHRKICDRRSAARLRRATPGSTEYADAAPTARGPEC